MLISDEVLLKIEEMLKSNPTEQEFLKMLDKEFPNNHQQYERRSLCPVPYNSGYFLNVGRQRIVCIHTWNCVRYGTCSPLPAKSPLLFKARGF